MRSKVGGAYHIRMSDQGKLGPRCSSVERSRDGSNKIRIVMNRIRWAVRRCVERADVCAVGQSAGIGEGNRIEG